MVPNPPFGCLADSNGGVSGTGDAAQLRGERVASMAERWDRVRGLAGREVRTAGHLERPFLVLAAEEEARQHLPATWRLPFTLLDRGVGTAYPAVVAGLLRALDEGAMGVSRRSVGRGRPSKSQQPAGDEDRGGGE